MARENLFMLRLRMRNAEAFDKAVSKKYIQECEDGHLEWMLGNKTLLAYFMGRLFCGDFGRYNRRKGTRVWMQGDGVFPSAALGELFGVSLLKQKRCKGDCKPLPEFSQLIDLLFDTDE